MKLFQLVYIAYPREELYETDLTGYLYAAAYHDKLSINEVNKLRLTPYDIKAYYNSGVLLMNLDEQRGSIDERDIFTFVAKNHARLVMPDQDILNALYSKKSGPLMKRYTIMIHVFTVIT
ncbi:hypothetical protein GCM10028778_00310 [Barrientosiimonas marina]|uniref:Glycosyltransferase n=1 Tax=Lentibacillus kimchii TaxID=1542911 RepID=A0ABW2UTZ1_9BACI